MQRLHIVGLAALGSIGLVAGALPGPAKPKPATSLVSRNAAVTGSGNGGSVLPLPSVSADGRFVAFQSLATDLVPVDANGTTDIFLRDVKKGTTARVNVDAAGTGAGNGISAYPFVSANGRYVAFFSGASDLVANDTNGRTDVFVRDLKRRRNTLVSVNAAGTGGGNQDAYGTQVISANGRFVAFESDATDLVANDLNGEPDVFVRDLKRRTTTLAGVSLSGGSSGNGVSLRPSISANGRFVAFESAATDLVPDDSNGGRDIFVRDLRQAKTILVSVNAAGTGVGNVESLMTSISADGRKVAFGSGATDLVTDDFNGGEFDVFVRDLARGATTLVSVDAAGTSGGNSGSSFPVISPDGRFVAFLSWASNLVPGDVNGRADVFLRDLERKTTTLVSVNASGTGGGNGDCARSPAVSRAGHVVVFESLSSDLVADDGNGESDVFVRRVR